MKTIDKITIYLNENDIFQLSPQELAKYFQGKYQKDAKSRIKYYIKKYSDKIKSGFGNHQSELGMRINTLKLAYKVFQAYE